MTSNYFEYNKEKTIQALRYHFISQREIKFMMILVNVFAIFAAAIFYLKKITPTAFLISSLLWFLMMMLFWFLLPRIIYRKNASFKDKFKVVFGENAFTISKQTSSRNWSWGEFKSWMESPHFFHLYFNEKSFFLIPKDAFDDENIAKARSFLKSNIIKSS
jgi:hypothetical protein